MSELQKGLLNIHLARKPNIPLPLSLSVFLSSIFSPRDLKKASAEKDARRNLNFWWIFHIDVGIKIVERGDEMGTEGWGANRYPLFATTTIRPSTHTIKVPEF